jgi:hypothetical protein
MMSSATSIKRATNGVRLKPDTAGTGQETDAGFRPWHFFVLASLMAATAAVVMARQSTPEDLILISVTIGAAGTAAAGLFRMLAPLAIADVALLRQPLSERSRAALEREKALVLRSIKELEFDRAMGKVSPRDFDEMAGRLRARALLVMKQVDDHSAYRELIEKELKARLSSRGHQAPAPPLDPPPMAAAPVVQAVEEILPVVDAACRSCGTPHDDDAAFCKRCGAGLQGAHS